MISFVFDGVIQTKTPLSNTHRKLTSTFLEVAVIVLLMWKAQSAALTKAGRLASMTAHVGH